jgi:hypothetical protein
LNETLHHPTPIQQGNHSIGGVFTQPGPAADICPPYRRKICYVPTIGIGTA